MTIYSSKIPAAPKPAWGTAKKDKLRAQVKSRFYYLFWGAATVSVFAGQLYVGSGYRQMSKSFNRIMDTIVVEVQKEVHDPEFPDLWDHPMVIK